MAASRQRGRRVPSAASREAGAVLLLLEDLRVATLLLNAARYMPVLVYAADRNWGNAAVDNHRQLIEALRRRDTGAVVEHTVWQFTDAATRLTEMRDRIGIFD